MLPGIQGIHPVIGTSASSGAGGVGVGSFSFDGTDDYIELSSAPVTNEPCTIVAWMKSANDNTKAICSIGDSAGNGRLRLAKLDNPQQDVSAAAYNSAGSSGDASGGNFPLSTWCHVAGTFTSDTARAVYLNGSSVGTDTTNISVSGLNSVLIGARYSGGTRGNFFNGSIAHVAIWDSVLSDPQIASLAAGALPSNIQASDLVFYAPLTNGTAVDIVTSTSLTVSGATSSSDGPL